MKTARITACAVFASGLLLLYDIVAELYFRYAGYCFVMLDKYAFINPSR